MSGLDAAAIVRRRMRAQRLTGEPHATPADAVAWSGAVQAQEFDEALWSVGMRARDCRAADVVAACDRGEILRTHVLRPTWHFVAAADLRWLLRLTGPRVLAKLAGRHRELALDARTLDRARDTLGGALADGRPRTRPQLAAVLQAAAIDTSGQRIAHIVMEAELRGVICSGTREGRQHTYVALGDGVPAAPDRSREDDAGELALRYFTSHGPATLRDFAWWSGLTVADGKAGVAAAGDRLESVDAAGAAWIAAPSGEGAPPAAPDALLLGTYDELLVAVRDLRYVDAGGRSRADLPRRPVVLGGRTVGRWTRTVRRREIVVEVALETAPGARGPASLRAAADRFGAFFELPATLVAPPR